MLSIRRDCSCIYSVRENLLDQLQFLYNIYKSSTKKLNQNKNTFNLDLYAQNPLKRDGFVVAMSHIIFV